MIDILSFLCYNRDMKAQEPGRTEKPLSFEAQNAILLSIQKYVDSQLDPKATNAQKSRRLKGISNTINRQLNSASKSGNRKSKRQRRKPPQGQRD